MSAAASLPHEAAKRAARLALTLDCTPALALSTLYDCATHEAAAFGVSDVDCIDALTRALAIAVHNVCPDADTARTMMNNARSLAGSQLDLLLTSGVARAPLAASRNPKREGSTQ